MASFTPTLRFAPRVRESPDAEESPDSPGAGEGSTPDARESYRATALTKRRSAGAPGRFDTLSLVTGLAAAPEPPEPAPTPPPESDPAYVEEMLETARRAGRAEAMAELQPRIDELEEMVESLGPALESLSTLRRQALEQAAGDVGDIIRAVCGRVLDESFSTQPGALTRIITDALAQLPEAEEVQIAVPPGMLEHVARAVDPRFRSCVVPDGNISTGCVVRTRYVTLDATLEAALAGVDAAVHEWLGVQPWNTGSL